MMSTERELALMSETMDRTMKRFLWWRQQWLVMAEEVHRTHCGVERTHLWRLCKSDLCQHFKRIVNEKSF
jgi:hypothetical protein